jgi:hypothetical protein
MTVLKVRDTDDGLTASESTEAFLNLSWEGDDSADEIIANIRAQRKNSKRFDNQYDLFN